MNLKILQLFMMCLTLGSISEAFNAESNQFACEKCGKQWSCMFANTEGTCEGFGAAYKMIDDNSLHLVLEGKTGSPDKFYMALGFNSFKTMDGAHVIECSSFGKESPSMKFSFNEIRSNIRLADENKLVKSHFTNTNFTFISGIQRCEANVNIQGWKNNPKVFTLNSSAKYYTLIAIGETDNKGLMYHQQRHISLEPDKVSLPKHKAVDPWKNILLKTHATLMITAWYMFVSTAVVCSKFLKQLWPSVNYWNLPIWIHLHRVFSILGLLTMSISFVCVVVAKGFTWNLQAKECVHTVMGIASIIIVYFLHMGSLIEHPPRLLMTFHRIFGFVAYLLAGGAITVATLTFEYLWTEKHGVRTAIAPLPCLTLFVLCLGYLAYDFVRRHCADTGNETSGSVSPGTPRKNAGVENQEVVLLSESEEMFNNRSSKQSRTRGKSMMLSILVAEENSGDYSEKENCVKHVLVVIALCFMYVTSAILIAFIIRF